MKPGPDLIYEYRMARESALRESERRREELYSSMPRLRDIARERRELLFNSGMLRLKGDVIAAQEALSKAESLNKEEADILRAGGYPAEYMQPRFRCKLCCDTGYVGDIEKRLCSCIKQRMREADSASSGINREETFVKFRQDIYPVDQQRKNALRAMEVCREYACSFPAQQPRDLLLMGGTGLGKSYLLNAIAAEVAGKGYEVWKTTAYNLIKSAVDRIRSREGMLDFTGPELILIDDLGTEPMMANITRETLFSLINERHSAGKATVWATNRQYAAIQETYGDRFFSRIIDQRSTRIMVLEGRDLRLRR